ncbi:MAG: RNA 2',3'-cyclic phosphodiesterase [Bacteroidales bacterium]
MNKELSEISSEINADEITIIGISTSVAGFTLVQQINSLFQTKLKLFRDFETFDKETQQIAYFKNYYYYNTTYRLKNFLLSNKNDENLILVKDKRLLKEKKSFDYVYILIGRDHNRHAEKLIESIKSIPNISLVRTIYPPEVETAQPSPNQKTKVLSLNLFEDNLENKNISKTTKKTKKDKLNISNVIEDVDYNIGFTMFEKRLFLGFKLTLSDKLLSKIDKAISLFALENIKPIRPENYHLTLCFIGNTSLKQMNKIKVIVQELLEKEYKGNMEIVIDGIDYFEESNNLISLHLRFEENDELIKLNYKIKEALKNKNLYNLNRDFIPHITIARIKNLKDQTKKENIKTELNEESEIIKLSPVILFESISIDNTKRYDVLQLFDIQKTYNSKA